MLTHNTRMFESTDHVERDAWVDRILEADDRFLQAHPDSSLFAYFTGTPDKSALRQTDQLSTWQIEEAERERRAGQNGGEYYERGALSTALIALESERVETARARERVRTLESQVATLQSDPLYSTTTSWLDADLTRQVRGSRLVRAVERRVRAMLRKGPARELPIRAGNR